MSILVQMNVKYVFGYTFELLTVSVPLVITLRLVLASGFLPLHGAMQFFLRIVSSQDTDVN